MGNKWLISASGTVKDMNSSTYGLRVAWNAYEICIAAGLEGNGQ